MSILPSAHCLLLLLLPLVPAQIGDQLDHPLQLRELCSVPILLHMTCCHQICMHCNCRPERMVLGWNGLAGMGWLEARPYDHRRCIWNVLQAKPLCAMNRQNVKGLALGGSRCSPS